MTRDQLIEKRKRKKLRRRLTWAGGAAAAVLFVFLVAVPLMNRPRRRADVAPQPESTQAETVMYETDTVTRSPIPSDRSGNIGWNTDDNGWWYMNPDQTIFTDGWKTLDGQRYYFTEDGYMATGWVNTGDVTDYYFNSDGVLDSSKHQKLVALTFDDGPSANTDLILDTLAKYDAKATFFVVGTQADYYRDELQREVNEGMEIGNHTWDHMTLKFHSKEEIQEQLDKNDELLMDLIGFTPTIMRPTGGGVDETVVTSVGRPMIQWDVDTLDWETKDPETTISRALDLVEDGSIILMHDLYQATAEASVDLIPALNDLGYKMVTISELAEAYGYDLEPGGIYYAFYPDGCEYNMGYEELLQAAKDGYTA